MSASDATVTLSFTSAARKVFALSLKPTLRSPRALIAWVLLIAPAFFGYQGLIEAYFTLKMLPLAALLLFAALLTEERERGTLIFLFTRPIDRRALMLGKYAVNFVIAAAPAFLAMAACSFASEHALDPRLPRDLGVVALALIVYGAVFTLIGVLAKRPILFGLLFVFIWEQAVHLPGTFPRLTLLVYLNRLMSSDAASTTDPAQISVKLSLIVLGAASLIALVTAAQIVRFGEYVSDADRATE